MSFVNRVAVLFVCSLVVAGLSAQPTPPGLRLPSDVRPIDHALELTVVPEAEGFEGKIDIELELAEARSLVWLNAHGVTAESATLDVAGRPVGVEIVPGGADHVGFAFERAVGPGRAKLHVSFRGKLEGTATRGLFKQQEGGAWYVFSQFEPVAARRAFPCFDEPSFKAPWQVTLRVRRDHVAVSNARAVSESDEPEGMKRVVFAKTPPLPSYLVALAVGPFDVLEAGKVGKRSVPFRIVTPKGMAEQGRYAASIVPEVLRRLEDYFGVPYPYDKLDEVAIPQTVGFGAMENPGLITYSLTSLLAKPEDLSVSQRRGLASTTAHELAHQWFGDHVTLAWWNDLWLNEAFATWMASKIVEEWQPEWDADVSRVRSAQRAMGSDALVASRRIRQPIAAEGDIENAFDGITYSKGAAVLAMFESWIGPSKFRDGVRRYVRKHGSGNATAEDFLASIESDGGSAVAAAFSTFLDQVGVPLVSVEVDCRPGQPPSLALAQKRYLPAGSEGPAGERWSIPLCARWGAAGEEGRACTVLAEPSARFVLDEAKHCPDWIVANDGARGYYRVAYRDGMLERLLQDGGQRLSTPERVGALSDVQALARADEIPMADALALVPLFAGDPDRNVVASVVGIAESVEAHLVPPELEASYSRFVREMFGARARELGLVARPKDDEDTRLLRESVVGLVADAGRDPELRAAARSLALRWLDDKRAVDPDSIGQVLAIAAYEGDRALFERYRAAAKATNDRRDRRRLMAALGSFRDPAIARDALGLLLTDEFDVRESISILRAAIGERATRDLAWGFFREHAAALAKRLPRESGATLPMFARGLCDEPRRAEAAALFQGELARFPGIERNLAQALESIRLCAVQREAQQESVSSFLARYGNDPAPLDGSRSAK